MAEEGIVKGLFGLSPYEIQQQRLASTNTQAHNYATLDPFQKASQSMFQAGAGLGGVGMQMAGYVDPEQQKAEQKQAILSKYDISTQEGMAQAMQAAKAMGRMDVVLDLQQYDNSMQKEYYARKKTQSEIDQNSARAEKMRRLQELKSSPEWGTWSHMADLAFPKAEDFEKRNEFLLDLSMRGTPNRNRKIVKTYTPDGREIQTVVDIDDGSTINVGSAKGDEHKAFDQGVPGSNPPLVQHMVWNSTAGMYEAVGEPKPAHAGINVKVDNITKPANAVAQFRVNVQKSIEPHYNIVTNADLGIAALQESLATGNFIDFNAARGSIAKAMGDTHISAADIKAAGGDPSLVGGFMDYLNKLGTGTPSKDTQKKMLATLRLLKKIASDKANSELSKQAKLGLMDNMSQEQVDAALDFPEFKPGTSKTPTQKVLKSGKTVTVEQD